MRAWNALYRACVEPAFNGGRTLSEPRLFFLPPCNLKYQRARRRSACPGTDVSILSPPVARLRLRRHPCLREGARSRAGELSLAWTRSLANTGSGAGAARGVRRLCDRLCSLLLLYARRRAQSRNVRMALYSHYASGGLIWPAAVSCRTRAADNRAAFVQHCQSPICRLPLERAECDRLTWLSPNP